MAPQKYFTVYSYIYKDVIALHPSNYSGAIGTVATLEVWVTEVI